MLSPVAAKLLRNQLAAVAVKLLRNQLAAVLFRTGHGGPWAQAAAPPLS